MNARCAPGNVDSSHSDSFWSADLDDIERQFLGNRRITDLNTMIDNRVPPQGRIEFQRTVDADNEVERLLKAAKSRAKPTNFFHDLYDRIVFG